MSNEHKASIVFDSSGLTALMNESDMFHDRALSISESITDSGWRVLLPREIFAETVTVISKRVSREAGVKAARAVLDRHAESAIVLVEANAPVYEQALNLLHTAKGARGAPSFFDCLVMAFASHYATPYIFGFDEAFAKNGYRLPETLKKEQAA